MQNVKSLYYIHVCLIFVVLRKDLNQIEVGISEMDPAAVTTLHA